MHLFRSSTPRPLIYLAALCLALSACGDDEDSTDSACGDDEYSTDIGEPGLQQLKVGNGNFLWSETTGAADDPRHFTIPEERLPDLALDTDDCLGSQGVQLFPGNSFQNKMDEYDAHFWTLERHRAHLDFSHSLSRHSDTPMGSLYNLSLGEATALLHIANADDTSIDLDVDWAIDGDTYDAQGGRTFSYANFEIQLYDPTDNCTPLDDEVGTIGASFDDDEDDSAIADTVTVNTGRSEVVVKLTVESRVSVDQSNLWDEPNNQEETVTSTADLDFQLDLDW